jgi:predicted ATPase/class 3 adenylate cyclase
MQRDLPSGVVTLLFTDVEGSTKLLHELGPERYAAALHEHRRLLRAAFERHGGVEVDTEGDAFFVAFPDPAEALAAAREATEALTAGPIRVRMGLHTGTPHLTDQGYVGVDVHKGARIATAAHGGQVVLSAATRLLLDDRFELLDLGEHRVKDFNEPIWLYQLGEGRFPPLKTISNTNLPRPASSFVGREREVGEIGALLRDGARLLTLTGPGGTGKTRLALEAAADLVGSFPNGVFWVALAALRDPALVPLTIGQTIGANDGLAAHIGAREMLLLLDNLEQVVAAAPELASLVEACPNLRLLATSRERLRVRGETEYAVPPLADVEVVELFCARAQLEPDAAILSLCRRLDGLPLAVELAAARTSVLSPAQIGERLAKRLDLLQGGRDAEARQATLRATIAWSYDLLSPAEQTLFARLAVFRGGFTLESAEAVAEADVGLLASLIDKSLVRRSDARFSMLETIREFAIERLEASGEPETVRRRHADFFLDMAEQAEPEVKRANPKAWLDRLDDEHDNLRAALDRLEAAGETEKALQLAGALMDFWLIRGHFQEGRRRLDRALASDGRPTRARARSLHGAVMLEDQIAHLPVARARAEEELRIYEGLGDAHGIAFALLALGSVAALAENWVEAGERWEASRQAFREVGDDHFYLAVTRSVAWVSEEMGDTARYRALAEEYTKGGRESGNERVLARGLSAQSMWAIEEGRFEDAGGLLHESYRIDSANGFVIHISNDLTRFAMVALGLGRPRVAAQLVAVSDRLMEDAGSLRESWAAKERDQVMAMIRAELPDPALSQAMQEGARLTPDEAVARVLLREPRTEPATRDPS